MKEYDEYDEVSGVEHESLSINLKPYIRKVLKSWKKILLWAVIGGAFGIMIGLSTPKTFTSTAVVAPEITTRASASGLNSLASMAGINMNSMAVTDAMHPDMYPSIINSSNFYIGLFDMPVTVETRDSLVHTDLYDYMLNYNKHPWWGYVFGLPRMAIEGVKGLFKSKDEAEEEDGHSNIDSLRLTRQQENVMKALAGNITVSVDKKSYVIGVQATMQDRVIAAQLVNRVVEQLSEFVTSYRTEKARENAEYYEKLVEETKNNYLAAQRAYTYYVDTHQGVTSRSSLVYQTQLQNEAQLCYQMYSKSAQNLLDAQAKVQLESPVLVVLQPGIAPNNGKPSKVRLAMLWFILGALLCTAWVCIRKEKK